MWGFVADSVSGSLCREYAAALGFFPTACQTRGGTPALALTLIVLFAAFVLVSLVRASRR